VIKIGDEGIFERLETVRQTEIQSSILLAHLAGNFLSPNGFVGFNGGSSDILQGSDYYIDNLERIAYSVAIK